MGKIYTALGLMSGTSMDGVDASIISSDGDREYSIKIEKYFEYSNELRQNIINIRDKVFLIDDLKAHSDEIKSLERELTLFHVKVVNEIIKTSKIEVDLLGFHGQTIFHDPEKKITKQLGDGKLLSQLTKKKVIYNFRHIICIKLPTCKLGAVLSKPIYALIFFLSNRSDNSFSFVHW